VGVLGFGVGVAGAGEEEAAGGGLRRIDGILPEPLLAGEGRAVGGSREKEEREEEEEIGCVRRYRKCRLKRYTGPPELKDPLINLVLQY
jgi:hypothetical protein